MPVPTLVESIQQVLIGPLGAGMGMLSGVFLIYKYLDSKTRMDFKTTNDALKGLGEGYKADADGARVREKEAIAKCEQLQKDIAELNTVKATLREDVLRKEIEHTQLQDILERELERAKIQLRHAESLVNFYQTRYEDLCILYSIEHEKPPAHLTAP